MPQPTLDRSHLRTVVFYSVLAGACPLIPVPFLDDLVLKQVLRRMVRSLTRAAGLKLRTRRVATLAGTRRPFRALGCLLGLVLAGAVKIIVKLITRIFRKILFVLTLKDVTDTASRAFHMGYLLSTALGREDARRLLEDAAAGEDEDGARALFATVDKICSEIDTRPINHILRRSFRSSRAALLHVAGRRRDLPDTDHSILASVVDDLSADLSEEKGYLRDLERRLEGALASTG